jgi:hypothetical protein
MPPGPRLDTNHDGKISSNELGAFLRTLVERVWGKGATGGGTTSSAPASRSDSLPPAASEPADIDPSTWTCDNCPYGITFAGFSPQDHTDLTLEDLGTPGKAEKYAVFDYLLTNRIQPTNDWAPRAADALNRKYHTTVYHAIDGESLGYGDEFVHSAPNGHGMARGTYNPNATGEFFWGWA